MKDKKHILPLMLLLSWATYVTAYLCRVNISVALEKLAVGMNVSEEYLGIASSLYFVTYAVGQLLNGFLGDRVDPYRFLILALSLTGGINAVLGLQTNGFIFLLLWGINGFCQSMFWCTLLRLLTAYTTEEQRKNVSTVMSTASVTGYLLSWVVLSTLFQHMDYQPYFLVPGVIALALLLIWFVVSRRLPFIPKEDGRPAAPPLAQVIKAFVKERLYFICFLCFLVGAIQEGTVFWMPKIFTSILNFGSDSILLLTLIPLAKLFGVFFARWVLSLLKERVHIAMRLVLALDCLVTILLVATSANPSWFTAILIILLIAGINASNWFMISYLPLYFTSRGMVSTLVGAFDFSTYVGASVMSGSLGILMLRYGWSVLPLLWLLLTCSSMALALTGAGSCLARKGAPL